MDSQESHLARSLDFHICLQSSTFIDKHLCNDARSRPYHHSLCLFNTRLAPYILPPFSRTWCNDPVSLYHARTLLPPSTFAPTANFPMFLHLLSVQNTLNPSSVQRLFSIQHLYHPTPLPCSPSSNQPIYHALYFSQIESRIGELVFIEDA